MLIFAWCDFAGQTKHSLSVSFSPTVASNHSNFVWATFPLERIRDIERVRDEATNKLQSHTEYRPNVKQQQQQQQKEECFCWRKATWTYCKLIVQFCSNICYSHPIKWLSRQVAKWPVLTLIRNICYHLCFFMWTIFVNRQHIHPSGSLAHTLTQSVDFGVIVDNWCSISKFPCTQP